MSKQKPPEGSPERHEEEHTCTDELPPYVNDCPACAAEIPRTLQDYRNAPSRIGPCAYDWSDKPHRVLFDLCDAVERGEITPQPLPEAARCVKCGHRESDRDLAAQITFKAVSRCAVVNPYGRRCMCRCTFPAPVEANEIARLVDEHLNKPVTPCDGSCQGLCDEHGEAAAVAETPFKSGTGMLGATEPGQRVTADNAHFLPPGSVVRLDDGDVLIHLHDDLWYVRLGAAGWCYDNLDRFLHRLPGTLCHHP